MTHLNPKVIIEKTELPNDTARGKYSLKSSIARSYQEYEKTIIDYMDFHFKEVYKGNSFPPEMLRDRADKYLKKTGGLTETSAYIALSGANGGIPYLLNLIAEAIKEEMKRAYFDYVITTFINPLSFQEVVELMREFKSSLVNYSPKSFAYIEPEAMAADYKEVIWNYIEQLTQYKNLWKY
jgi:hypothetical protein